MKDGDLPLETSREIFDHGRGEGNLGNKHQHTLSLLQISLSQMQIDLGFPRPGNPFQQIDGFFAMKDGLIGFSLLDIEFMGLLFFEFRNHQAIPFLLKKLYFAFIDQCLYDAWAADFLFEHLTAVFHQTQGLFLLGRQPFLVLIFDSQIRVIGNLGAFQGAVRGL